MSHKHPEDKMQDEEIKQEEVPVVNEVEVLKQELAEARKSIDALVAKKDELYKETKAAKEEKRRQAEIAETIKKEQLQLAEKNGEFEKLYKFEQEEKQKILEEKQKLENVILQEKKDRRKEKIEIQASNIANELAKDPEKAVLLKRFVADSLSNLADDYGQIEEDVLRGVREQFESDKLYTSLRAGNQSVGGSAPGNTRGVVNNVKQLTTEEFFKLDSQQRHAYSMAVAAGKAKPLTN